MKITRSLVLAALLALPFSQAACDLCVINCGDESNTNNDGPTSPCLPFTMALKESTLLGEGVFLVDFEPSGPAECDLIGPGGTSEALGTRDDTSQDERLATIKVDGAGPHQVQCRRGACLAPAVPVP